MKNELDYFRIGNSYGGCQDWFTDPMMHLGGCAAAAACDSSIYFAIYKGIQNLYPYDENGLTKQDYVRFSSAMKPYLHPRWSGIDRLEIYIDGFERYLLEHGCESIAMEAFPGDEKLSDAQKVIKKQIDNGFPIPCLVLKHSNANFKEYVWHWFLLTGYDEFEDSFMVKAVTYGNWRWLSLDELWSTGHRRKGGLVLYKDLK